MAKASRAFTNANAAVSPGQQQRMIAEQTAAFLAGGGHIQQIPKGVSGQPRLGGPQLAKPEPAAEVPA